MGSKIFKIAACTALCVAIYNDSSAQKRKSVVAPVVLPTPAAERSAGIERRKNLVAASTIQTAFRNVGPNVMSGRVVDVDVNPGDPTEFYVAYATGGLWHTVNNGQSFTPVFDTENAIGLGDVAVNWKNNIIWLGTGEANSSRSSYSGIGIYNSVDGGKHWNYLGLPESHHIGEIILHPNEPGTAWVAVTGHLYSPNKERGIYKTSDGGKSWRQTLFINETTGGIEMDINPLNANELYACMWHKTRTAWNFVESGSTSGLYKSTDGGEHWQLLSVPGSGLPTGAGVGRMGIAVSPKNPNTIFAIVDNQDHQPDTAKRKKTDSASYGKNDLKGLDKAAFAKLDEKRLDTFLKRNRLNIKYSAASLKLKVAKDSLTPTALYDYLYDANDDLFNTPIIGAEIYRSDDGGIKWRKVNEEKLDLYNTYGYYFGRIYVSPANTEKLVITGYDIELSTNGGKTWKRFDKRNVHADHHSCWINPGRDSHMIIGNDGGVNITYDNGENWFKANSPAVGQFYAITTDNATPYRVYGGLQDNGVWYGYTTRQRTNDASFDTLQYKSAGGGDGMMVQVDTRDNKTLYSGYQFGFYSRQDVERSGGLGIHPSNELGEAPYRYNWCTPILLSKHNQDIFYMGSSKFHRSLNRGADMQTLSPDLTNGKRDGDVPYGTITTLSESPLKFGLLYAGTDDGNIQLSRDGGYTWQLVSGGLPAGLWVSRVAASAHKAGRVFATLNGYRMDHFAPYVFVSEDFGTTWTELGKGLPADPVNVIKEDPKKDSLLYVGTDAGLFVSRDRGQSWMGWQKGLPFTIPIHDIAIQERENEILLGTHGRSIYVASLNELHGIKSKPAARPARPDDDEEEPD